MSLPNYIDDLEARLGVSLGRWLRDNVCTQLDVTAGTGTASKAFVLNSSGNGTIPGTLGVTGATTLSSTLAVTGVSTLTGGWISTGEEQDFFSAASASGAITQKSGIVYITKAGVAAMTLADPTAVTDDGKKLLIIAATANAHTIDNSAGSGFNAGGAATDVATLGGAIGDNIFITAKGGKWLVISKVNATLG